MTTRTLAAGALAALLVTSCSSGDAGTTTVGKSESATVGKSESATPEPEPEVDSVGGQACDTFRILIVEADTMTEAELDDAVANLYREWGRFTDTVSIQQATRAMAVSVANQDTGLRRAVRDMDRACMEVGR